MIAASADPLCGACVCIQTGLSPFFSPRRVCVHTGRSPPPHVYTPWAKTPVESGRAVCRSRLRCSACWVRVSQRRSGLALSGQGFVGVSTAGNNRQRGCALGYRMPRKATARRARAETPAFRPNRSSRVGGVRRSPFAVSSSVCVACFVQCTAGVVSPRRRRTAAVGAKHGRHGTLADASGVLPRPLRSDGAKPARPGRSGCPRGRR